jgi:hypothetical protein
MLTWLVIGVGDITSKRVLPAILTEERSQLAGIVTRDPAKAVPYSVPAFTTLEAALEESEAAAVYVASPVLLHAPQSIAALAAQRHVLCEKPMAMNVAEAERMVAVARASRRTFGVVLLSSRVPQGPSRRGIDPVGRDWPTGARVGHLPHRAHRHKLAALVAVGPRPCGAEDRSTTSPLTASTS